MLVPGCGIVPFIKSRLLTGTPFILISESLIWNIVKINITKELHEDLKLSNQPNIHLVTPFTYIRNDLETHMLRSGDLYIFQQCSFRYLFLLMHFTLKIISLYFLFFFFNYSTPRKVLKLPPIHVSTDAMTFPFYSTTIPLQVADLRYILVGGTFILQNIIEGVLYKPFYIWNISSKLTFKKNFFQKSIGGITPQKSNMSLIFL